MDILFIYCLSICLLLNLRCSMLEIGDTLRVSHIYAHTVMIGILVHYVFSRLLYSSYIFWCLYCTFCMIDILSYKYVKGTTHHLLIKRYVTSRVIMFLFVANLPNAFSYSYSYRSATCMLGVVLWYCATFYLVRFLSGVRDLNGWEAQH